MILPSESNSKDTKDPTFGHQRTTKLKIFVAVNIGNVLEWYDWTVFAIFSTYFASSFFHGENDVSNLLSVLMVFAAGFALRPLGGFFFGRLADRQGRRLVLVVTMSLVAACSLLIGVAPTYEQIGVLASLWLVLARCLQGFAHGGELGGSYTYIAEAARPRNRALWGSTIIMSTVVGTVLATLLGAILRTGLSEQEVMAWGWRVPFVVGGILGVLALYLRRNLQESATFSAEQDNRPGDERVQRLRELWEQRGSILRVMVIVAGTTVISYTWSVSAPAYAQTFYGVDDQAALWAGVVANLVFIAALPLAAMLADRAGRRFNFVLWGLGMAIFVFPLSWLLSSGVYGLLLAMCLALTLQSLGASIQVAWFAELFSTRSRATGVGIAVSVSAAVFGGTAPYLNSWLTANGLSELFTGYAVILALAGILVAFFTPETKGTRLVESKASEYAEHGDSPT